MKAQKHWIHVLLVPSLIASQFPPVAQQPNPGATQASLSEPATSTTNDPIQYSQFSTTWQSPDGSYTTIFSPGTMNYQDRNGEWKTVDARFKPDQDSFVVEQNGIQTRLDNRRVWFSAVVGETLFAWESLTLGSVSSSGEFVPIAAPKATPPPSAYRRQENRQLVYENAWDDDRLSETLISSPGSLEHSLILEQKPAQLPPQAEYLELRARPEHPQIQQPAGGWKTCRLRADRR